MSGRFPDIIRTYLLPVMLSSSIALFVESYYIAQDGLVLRMFYDGIQFIYKLLGG